MTDTNGSIHTDARRSELIKNMLAFRPILLAFAMSLTFNDKSRAEDLVQQTFLKAIPNLDRFEYGTNLEAWLMTILRNEHFTVFRRRKREAEWDPKYENSMQFSVGAEGWSEGGFDYHRILQYLACLSAEHRDALIAVGYLGMSYEEAAERFECKVGTIKSRVSRARNDLASLIAGARITQVNLEPLKTATRGVPVGHPYYPIAKAYEDLYVDCEGVSDKDSNKPTTKVTPASEADNAWNELVASGALDENNEALSDLMRGDFDDL